MPSSFPARQYALVLVCPLGKPSRYVGRDEIREAVTVFDRTVELLDLTIADEGLKGRQKELTRTLEVLWDAMFDGRIYEIDLASLDRHFPTPPWPPEPTVSGARWKDARYKTSPRFLKEQNE